MTNYIGKAALTLVRAEVTGSPLYVHGGEPVPEDVDPEDLRRLVDEGYLVSAEEADAALTADEQDGPPAKSAAKPEWEAYARSQGATDEDLDGATKDDLVEKYGA